VSVNAPESGVIKEFLVNEEDTVTVGQDLVKLEAGGAPEKKSEDATEKPKEPAATSPEPEQPKAPEPKQSSSTPEKAPSPPKTPSPDASSKPSPQTLTKPQPSEEPKSGLGGREERRVGHTNFWGA
jgi:2-oxoglutarate dehydrogenase E2 component (dihydrolipoamide succinyltransferase)